MRGCPGANGGSSGVFLAFILTTIDMNVRGDHAPSLSLWWRGVYLPSGEPQGDIIVV